MQKILISLIIFLSWSTLTYSQDTTHFTIPMEYIYSIDSMSQKELYSAFLSWVAVEFKSANNVIQNKDPESCEVVIKYSIYSQYSMNRLSPMPGNTFLTLTFRCKDGKIKIFYDNIYFKGSGQNYYFERNYDEFRSGVISQKIYWRKQLEYLQETNNAILLNNIDLVSYLRQYHKKQTDW